MWESAIWCCHCCHFCKTCLHQLTRNKINNHSISSVNLQLLCMVVPVLLFLPLKRNCATHLTEWNCNQLHATQCFNGYLYRSAVDFPPVWDHWISKYIHWFIVSKISNLLMILIVRYKYTSVKLRDKVQIDVPQNDRYSMNRGVLQQLSQQISNKLLTLLENYYMYHGAIKILFCRFCASNMMAV